MSAVTYDEAIGSPKLPPRLVNPFLSANHYLGPTGRGWAWSDEWGVMVWTKPTSRRLPQDGTWLELSRWCLLGIRNGGSRQFASVRRYMLTEELEVTTLVSYSDPSAGHTGALYKACNWYWAPTWHRLKPPPSGNGKWKDGPPQSVKDRWAFDLRKDSRREQLLKLTPTPTRVRAERSGE
jgi:hypothetical protein